MQFVNVEQLKKNQLQKQILNKKNIKEHLNPYILKQLNIKSDSRNQNIKYVTQDTSNYQHGMSERKQFSSKRVTLSSLLKAQRNSTDLYSLQSNYLTNQKILQKNNTSDQLPIIDLRQSKNLISQQQLHVIKFKNDQNIHEYTSLLGCKKSDNAHIKIKEYHMVSLINTKDFKLKNKCTDQQFKLQDIQQTSNTNILNQKQMSQSNPPVEQPAIQIQISQENVGNEQICYTENIKKQSLQKKENNELKHEIIRSLVQKSSSNESISVKQSQFKEQKQQKTLEYVDEIN